MKYPNVGLPYVSPTYASYVSCVDTSRYIGNQQAHSNLRELKTDTDSKMIINVSGATRETK
jgi:hypothetical protein